MITPPILMSSSCLLIVLIIKVLLFNLFLFCLVTTGKPEPCTDHFCTCHDVFGVINCDSLNLTEIPHFNRFRELNTDYLLLRDNLFTRINILWILPYYWHELDYIDFSGNSEINCHDVNYVIYSNKLNFRKLLVLSDCQPSTNLTTRNYSTQNQLSTTGRTMTTSENYSFMTASTYSTSAGSINESSGFLIPVSITVFVIIVTVLLLILSILIIYRRKSTKVIPYRDNQSVYIELSELA